MTRPEAMKLGPFTGGLNLLSESQSIDNSELVECINFEVDLDGSLMNRPAITETTGNGSNGAGRWKMIGRANFSAGGNYIIASNPNGTSAFDGISWTYISSTVSDVAVQYNDNIYIVARQDSGVNGGRWDGTTFTSDATIPRGKAALFHKSRMFVVPGVDTTTTPSRLTFSDTITGVSFTWNAANIIDVSPGDGENLIDLVVYNDNLLLFKENSIYLLAYDISPSNAVLRKVHSNIGVNQQHCMDTADNSVFFLHEGSVWEMMNYEFKKISEKVPFVLDTSIPADAISVKEKVWLRKVGDRLLVGFHAKRYAYNLLTRSWSEWKCSNIEAQYMGPPLELLITSDTNDPVKYYFASAGEDYPKVFYITDKYVAGTQDYISNTNLPIQCSIKTKSYDFDVPFVWKRLTWWGMHALTGTLIEANAIINNAGQTNDLWENIGLRAWNDLPGTWDNILNEFEVTTSTQGSADGGTKFYKFLKSLRFRVLSFKIVIENDGTTTGGPCRLYSLTATVGYKQVVAKGMN